MALIKGDQLRLVQKLFGLSSKQISGTTDLIDSDVTQVLEILPILRRSSAPFRRGIFYGRLQNNHVVVSDLQSFLNPYAPVSPQGGFPDPVDPSLFDIWLLGASTQVSSGEGALINYAFLTIDMPEEMQGLSRTAVGGSVTPADKEFPVAQWKTFTTSFASGDYPNAAAGSLPVYQTLNMRLDPLEQVTLRSESNGVGTPTVDCILRFAIMPIATGQDAG